MRSRVIFIFNYHVHYKRVTVRRQNVLLHYAPLQVGHFVVLGQFVAREMPVKQCFFMSASVGHFVAREEMGHFVAGTICGMGRERDILSSGTICRP